MNNKNNSEATVHTFIKLAKEKAEDQILRAYYASVFEMSPLVDTFATWLLVVVGGTASLTITNVESISSILPFANIKVGLGLLFISGLCGFSEKYLALLIRQAVAQESKLRDTLQKTSEEFYGKIRQCELLNEATGIEISKNVDTRKPLNKFTKAHPWYKRIQLRKEKDITPEDALRKRLRTYYRQLAYMVIEFIGFLMFVMIAVFSI